MAVERGQEEQEQEERERTLADDDAVDRAVDAAVEGPDDGAVAIDERRAKLDTAA